MRIKHVIGIAFTCMVFIFSCQAQGIPLESGEL